VSYWEVVPDEESSPVMDADGVVRWRLPDKRLHRLGGPAIERPDGDRSWWEHGKLHRMDGPARERANGRGNIGFVATDYLKKHSTVGGPDDEPEGCAGR